MTFSRGETATELMLLVAVVVVAAAAAAYAFLPSFSAGVNTTAGDVSGILDRDGSAGGGFGAAQDAGLSDANKTPVPLDVSPTPTP